MKIATLVTCLLTTYSAVYAQTEPGRGLWSANLQLNANQQTNLRSTDSYSRRSPDLSLTINHGVFLNRNWLVGGSLSGNYYKELTKSGVSSLERTRWTGGLSAYVRKYWGKDQWRIYVGGGLSGSREHIDQSGNDNTNAAILPREVTYHLRPLTQIGGVYFLNNRWGLELSTTSSAFPFSFSTFNAGLIYMTGFTPAGDAITSATPPAEGSQTRAGRLLVGLGANFDGTTNQTGDSQSLTASPSIGFFVADNVVVGITVPLSWTWVNARARNVESNVGVSPYVKGYLANTRLRPYLSAAFTYSVYSFKQHPYPKDRISKTVGGTLGGGLAYLLGRHFIVEANLINLNVAKETQNNAQENGLWNETLQLTTAPTFAVQYVF